MGQAKWGELPLPIRSSPRLRGSARVRGPDRHPPEIARSPAQRFNLKLAIFPCAPSMVGAFCPRSGGNSSPSQSFDCGGLHFFCPKSSTFASASHSGSRESRFGVDSHRGRPEAPGRGHPFHQESQRGRMGAHRAQEHPARPGMGHGPARKPVDPEPAPVKLRMGRRIAVQ